MKLRALRRVGLAAVAVVPVAAAIVALPGAEGAGRFKSAGTGGITWSASTPSDPQRDVGEPEIHIDKAGNIYTCGPSGFSNIADYAQVSTDGGDQFHLLGAPPRGQLSAGEGGGDCGLASAPYKNAQGHYNFAYTGLGPLTNFSTATSSDTGKTFLASPISESPPGVDRQWNVFTDATTALFNYNHLARGYTVQKSTDGGLTYGLPVVTGNSGGRIGPMRAILDKSKKASKALVYFPSYKGTRITLDISLDGGDTWKWCEVIDAELNPSAGFVVADHDSAGNVYIAYTEKGGDNDTYYTAVPAANMRKCKTSGVQVLGTGRQHRVNRDKVETTVMPWIVAGDRGRIAIAYFGTESIGNPDDGKFKASWYPYVGMTVNALSKNPSWYQTKASSHPFHYGSICLNGLGCTLSVPEGDRSLADYFAMDLSPTTGRLHIVYGASAKKPTDAVGHLSTATVVTQETGPSLLGGKLKARRPAVRNTTTDRSGDALAPYSNLFLTPTRANTSALDVQRVDVSPEINLTSGKPVSNGGVTVTIKVRSLTDSSLQDALVNTRSQSLVWLFRFLNGYQPAGATMAWSPAAGFTFGFDDFTTRSTESGQYDPTAEKIVVWPQANPVSGKVNQDAGVIQINIPRSYLKALTGGTGRNQVPSLKGAKNGSKFYDATVWTMGNMFTPVQVRQSYLYQVDQSAAMDFVVGRGPKARPGVAFR
ncbi:MAG TPA: sialidase family protein [Frankiaceae bacterium]|nr:sialidase family protein [Frankiaceae bacterium]